MAPSKRPEGGDDERERGEGGRRAGQRRPPAAGEPDGEHDRERLDRFDERCGERRSGDRHNRGQVRHRRASRPASAAGRNGQLERRARESHRPPPIKTVPDSRPSSFARLGFMNHARPMPAATAQAQSETPARMTVTTHMTASCGPAGSLGSRNCGRKAVKKTIVFGLRQRDQNSAREPGPPGLHQPRVAFARMPPRLDAEPNEIGRAGPAQSLEEEVGVRVHPAERGGDRRQEHGVAERRAGGRGQRGAPTLEDAGRDDEGHDRARRDDEDDRDQEKGGEEFDVHVRSLQPSRRIRKRGQRAPIVSCARPNRKRRA